jgi:Family of unknown function (DUF6476)
MSDTTSDSAAADGGPLGPAGVRALKIAILVMTVLLVLGVLGLIARVIYLANRPSAQATAARIAASGTLPLPAGATVRSLSLAGDRVAVHYDTPSGSGIAILDLVQGNMLARYTIVPEPPKP